MSNILEVVLTRLCYTIFVLFTLHSSASSEILGLACGYEGRDFEICRDSAEQWAARTGNIVLTYPVPDDRAERLDLFDKVLSEDAPKFDVIELEASWASALSEHLLTLETYLPYAIPGQSPVMLRNLTVDGELKGLPFHGAPPGIYYRTDLLEKYGLDVPLTWDALQTAAATIQAGERAEGNNAFWGYVFQGDMGLSLSANAAEWLISHRGVGIAGDDGRITLDHPDYIEALERAAGWIGTISPPEVLNYDEEDVRAVFQQGNAAFMRNLPYVYPLLNSPISPVSGNVGAEFMPSANNHPPVAMMDGWALVIAKRTSNPDVAASLVRHLASIGEQRRRALEASFFPSQIILFSDREVRSYFPIVEDYEEVEGNIRMRPRQYIGRGYAEATVAFQSAVQSVLRGERDAASTLKTLEKEITEILNKAAKQ